MPVTMTEAQARSPPGIMSPGVRLGAGSGLPVYETRRRCSLKATPVIRAVAAYLDSVTSAVRPGPAHWPEPQAMPPAQPVA